MTLLKSRERLKNDETATVMMMRDARLKRWERWLKSRTIEAFYALLSSCLAHVASGFWPKFDPHSHSLLHDHRSMLLAMPVARKQSQCGAHSRLCGIFRWTLQGASRKMEFVVQLDLARESGTVTTEDDARLVTDPFFQELFGTSRLFLLCNHAGISYELKITQNVTFSKEWKKIVKSKWDMQCYNINKLSWFFSLFVAHFLYKTYSYT